MSSAGWFVILLAVVAANLPFAGERVFALLPAPGGRKTVWLRIVELLVLYGVVGGLGYLLEARAGNVFTQGWQFYAVTFSLFIVLAFPGFTFRYLLKHR